MYPVSNVNEVSVAQFCWICGGGGVLYASANDFTLAVNLLSDPYQASVRQSGGSQTFDAAGIINLVGYLVRESMLLKK